MCGQGFAGVQQKRLAGLVSRTEGVVVETQVDHRDAVGVDPHALHQRLLHVSADRDHGACPLEGLAVREAPIQPLRASEELREEDVLDVEQADHGRWVLDAGQHHRQREVDRVEPVDAQLPPETAGAAIASLIARSRPGIERLARYDVIRRPSTSSTIDGVKTSYSSLPTLPSARTSSRAYISDPPTTPGTSVNRLIPTLIYAGARWRDAGR